MKTQSQPRFWSRLGVLGGVYAVLFVIASVLLGEPGSGTGGAAVVGYYRDRQGAELAGVFAVAFAVVALTFFLASLRRRLSASDEGRFLASVVTAGGAVYAAALMTMTAVTVALIDAAKDGLPAAAQTLNVLGSDLWPPVVVGLALLGLGTGVAALRGGALPRWLGWASVAFGLLALAGPAGGIAFEIAPAWALVTGIALMRAPRAAAAPADPAAHDAPQQWAAGSR